MSVGLRILKIALIPFVPEALLAAGEDAVKSLPPSSPVIKSGFDFDARDAFRMINAFTHFFVEEDESKDLKGQIRQLSRLRDQWAHQQTLSDQSATRFCQSSAQLLKRLGREPEARALRHLSSRPPEFFGHFVDMLTSINTRSRGMTARHLMAELDLDPDDMDDIIRFHKAIIWSAAVDTSMNGTEHALLIDQQMQTPGESHGRFPDDALWWVLNLAHDAPEEVRQAAYDDWLFQLDPHAGCA